MQSNKFSVSAIIPVYNGEAFLAEAIGSILLQDYEPLEIIVVDDGSIDDTAKIATTSKGNIRYAYQSNEGPPAARNRGLKMSRGDIVGFLDADDLWSRNKLKLQIARMDENQLAEVILGRTQKMRVAKVVDGKPKFEPFFDPAIDLNLSSAVFRRSVFDKVGFFDERMRHCDDWDWFTRAREIGIPMVIHEEVTLFYRKHENNITNNKEIGNHYTLQMLKKSLDRRRQRSDGIAESLRNLSNFKKTFNIK